MDASLLAYIFGYGPLVLIFVAAVLVPVIGVGLAVSRPALLILGYIAILLSFTQTSYGALEFERTIYSRGTGQLFFSFLSWTLIGLAVALPFLARWSGKKPVPINLGIPFLLLLLLFIGHLLVGHLLDVKISQVFSKNGFINLIFMGLLIFVMTRAMNERLHLIWFEKLLLAVGAVRAGYGLVRWAALGGDTSNVYENVEHLGFKITYFDICDNMIAGVVLIYCLRRLFSDWTSLRGHQRLLLIALAAMEIALIALSYRRTAWGGLALVLAFFVVLLPHRQRIAALIAAPFVAVPVLSIASTRLGKVAHGQGFFRQFFYDLYSKNQLAGESTRVLELKATTQTILDNPIFGTGAWGHYRGASGIAWQTGPDAFTFVHSGVLHILLKTGLVGTAIVVAAMFLFIRFVIRARRTLVERDRWLLDAALAGLIFMIPDFMLGTPVPQYRTMLLYGVMLAIPYVIAEISRRERAAPTQ
jgi:O-antigen ligase